MPVLRKAQNVVGNYMTTAQNNFKKAISKTNWFDKYFFSVYSITLIALGVFFFYFISKNHDKFKDNLFFYYISVIFLISLGCYSLFLLSNRYKVLTFPTSLSKDKKKNVIRNTIKYFEAPYFDKDDHIWRFMHQQHWWTNTYDTFLTFDDNNIYVIVLLRTGTSGFIDLGGTERFRKKVSGVINCYLDTQ